MRVVFIFNEYSLHNQVIEKFIAAHPGSTVGIVKVRLVLKGKSRFSTANRVLPQLSRRFIIGKLLEHLSLLCLTFIPKLLSRGAIFRRLGFIARRNKIPFHDTDNIHALQSVKFVRDLKPDVVVTMMHQIVKHQLLAVPKCGTINIHPGLLPEFRGIQPYFWCLAHGSEHSGVTLHLIEDENIDTGRILARVQYPTIPNCSVHLNYFLGSVCAAATLPKVVDGFVRGEITPISQDSEVGNYYRWPDSAAFNQLRARGHSLFSWQDLWKIISGAYDDFHPLPTSGT